MKYLSTPSPRYKSKLPMQLNPAKVSHAISADREYSSRRRIPLPRQQIDFSFVLETRRSGTYCSYTCKGESSGLRKGQKIGVAPALSYSFETLHGQFNS